MELSRWPKSQGEDVEEAGKDSDSEVVEIEEEGPAVTARQASQALRILQRCADTFMHQPNKKFILT